MIETRSYLMQRGMSSELADQLAKRYINKLELLARPNETKK